MHRVSARPRIYAFFRSPGRRSLNCSTSLAAKGSRASLPTSPARTRFAPSPTGFLHLGSLRTALFNYLLARKTGGQFLLRVEDTDQKRTVPGAVERLCSDLQWAGLQWDEGPDTIGSRYGSYKQSERADLYQEHANKLVESGHAYRCFCSTERLNELARQRQLLGLPTDYDRQCAGIPREESDSKAHSGEAHVIRLLAPEQYPEVNDLVYGKIGKGKSPATGGPNIGVTYKYGEVTYEDPVLLKSDGQPTYHLANVVDDHYMDITHVVRATEWISSTPKHLALYEAFGWAPPAFAHVGLLVDEAGHKLSKRNFDTDVAQYRNMGILPSTLVNFVALLGWSHGQRSDVMTLEELVNEFRMQFTKGNTTVTLEKLWFLQRAHAARAATTHTSELDDMAKRVEAEVHTVLSSYSPAADAGVPTASPYNAMQDQSQHMPSNLAFLTKTARGLKGTDYCRGLLRIDAKNYKTPAEFVKRNLFFFVEPPPPSAFVNPEPEIATTEELFAATEDLMASSELDWNVKALNERMRHITRQNINTSTTAKTEPSKKDDVTVGKGESVPTAATSKAALALEKAYSKLFHDFLRWILLGGAEGPSSAPMMELLGREVCVQRLFNSRAVMHEAGLKNLGAADRQI